MLHALFTVCTVFAADRKGKETRGHAIDTLSIMLHTVLAKNLAGWEVMEIFANSVNEADRVFMVRSMRHLHLHYILTVAYRSSLG